MKLIDAEKLIAEIERRIKDCKKANGHFKPPRTRNAICYDELADLLEIIHSLQQEQPEGGCSEKPNNLPSNLDEAAEEYAYKTTWDHGVRFDSFKAGAEWMAEQGVAKEAVIGMATEEISINVSQQTLDELDLCPGDKVIVQIRMK